MPSPSVRSLELLVLQAHRAKGVRYPTSIKKDCFKTWYSYALRRGGVENTNAKNLQEHGRYIREVRVHAPGGRTYLWMPCKFFSSYGEAWLTSSTKKVLFSSILYIALSRWSSQCLVRAFTLLAGFASQIIQSIFIRISFPTFVPAMKTLAFSCHLAITFLTIFAITCAMAERSSTKQCGQSSTKNAGTFQHILLTAIRNCLIGHHIEIQPNYIDFGHFTEPFAEFLPSARGWCAFVCFSSLEASNLLHANSHCFDYLNLNCLSQRWMQACMVLGIKMLQKTAMMNKKEEWKGKWCIPNTLNVHLDAAKSLDPVIVVVANPGNRVWLPSVALHTITFPCYLNSASILHQDILRAYLRTRAAWIDSISHPLF
jgi:hypothetical protein